MIARRDQPPGRQTSLRDTVREAVLLRIGDGLLAPGERIVEARLAEEFGVSAIPVREAIRELVSMGVLDFANNKGAWVREVNLTETVDALQVKAALEAQAALPAAARLKGDCTVLQRLCVAMGTAARRRDFVAYQRHNQAFHRHIVVAAGNRILLRVWEGLAFEVRTRRIMEFLRRGKAVGIAQEHDAIVRALETGNGPRAATLLANHTQHLVEYLQREIAAPPPLPTPAATPVRRAKKSKHTAL